MGSLGKVGGWGLVGVALFVAGVARAEPVCSTGTEPSTSESGWVCNPEVVDREADEAGFPLWRKTSAKRQSDGLCYTYGPMQRFGTFRNEDAGIEKRVVTETWSCKGPFVDGAYLLKSPAGQMLAKGSYVEGHRVGPWTLVTEGGQGTTTESGELCEDLKCGAWTERYVEGESVTVSTGRYAAGERCGDWSIRVDKEPPVLEAHDPCPADGPFTEKHENGKKSVAGQRKGGVALGVWTYWNEEGVETAKGSYCGPLKCGRWTERDVESDVVESGRYFQDKRCGEWKRTVGKEKPEVETLEPCPPESR